MELVVRPVDLRAAASALSASAARLEEAGSSFGQAARIDIPDLGVAADQAAHQGVAAAERAVGVMATDLHRLGQALEALASFYPQLDSTAVNTP